MAASNIPLTSTLVRQNDADFALADGSDIAGGGCVVVDLNARDILPSAVLKVGMLCYVQDVGGGIGERFVLAQISPSIIWLPYVPSGALPDPTLYPDGAVPVVRTGVWVYDTRLTQDDIDPGFAIMGFAAGFATTNEIGTTIANPAFTASYNAALASAHILDGTHTDAIALPATSFAYGAGGIPGRSYTQSTPNATQGFTLSVVPLSGPTKTAGITAVWRAKTFYGAQTPASIDAAFIASLPTNGLASGFAGTYAIGTLGNTKKAYLSFPTSYGTPTIFKNAGTGFAVPFSKVGSAIAVTNGLGATVNYDVWASDNLLNAAFNLQVS